MQGTPSHDDLARLRRANEALAQRYQLLQTKYDIAKLRDKLDNKKRKGSARSRDQHAAGSKKRSRRMSTAAPPGRMGVVIKSPKSNANITVGGRKNKAFRQLVKGAEATGWDIRRKETEWVIDAVAQARLKGFTWMDPDFIPQHIQDMAAKQAGDVGLQAPDGAVDTSDTEGSRFGKAESFRNLFHVYELDMRPRPDSKVSAPVYIIFFCERRLTWPATRSRRLGRASWRTWRSPRGRPTATSSLCARPTLCSSPSRSTSCTSASWPASRWRPRGS